MVSADGAASVNHPEEIDEEDAANEEGEEPTPSSSSKYKYDRQCPSCGSVLSTLYALKLHINKKHPKEESDLIPLIKQTQWRCMQFPCTVDINCTVVCKGRKELLEHMQNDHGVVVSEYMRICIYACVYICMGTKCYTVTDNLPRSQHSLTRFLLAIAGGVDRSQLPHPRRVRKFPA